MAMQFADQQEPEPTAILLRIEFKDYIARRELSYILEATDRIVENHLLPEFRRRRTRDRGRPVGSYLAIRSANEGSIELLLWLGQQVAEYIAQRFIARATREVAERLAIARTQGRTPDPDELTDELNRWGSRYVARVQGRGSHITAITFVLKKPLR